MSSPLLRWSVLAFACLWFGMLVPVHQRGQIQLPGPAVAACDTGTCPQSNPVPACHTKKSASQCDHKGHTTPDDAPATPKRGGGGCAVCHFIAGLHAPPPAVVYEANLGLLESRPAGDVPAIPLRHAALPFHGLDPPTV